MLVLAACLIAVASPLAAGRWPAALLLRTWRSAWLIWVALAVQIVVIDVPLPRGVAATLHVATYVAALAFLWRNREVRGVLAVALGAALNGVTIALNGGVLPARPDAVATAGLDPDHAFANSAVVDSPVLPWLGDVFAWPAPLPLANTFSVGDVLIVAGVAWVAWAGSQRIGQRREPVAGAVPAVRAEPRESTLEGQI